MTIVEFLHPLKSGAVRDVSLAALYFSERYKDQSEATVEELRALLKRARIAGAAKRNLADVLAKSAPYVDTAGKRGRSLLWTLTTAGREHVRTLLGLPEAEAEIEHDVASLEALLSNISDTESADYVAEAIKCLSVGALRAAVVFLWVGAVRKIQQDCMGYASATVDTAVRKYDPKVRTIGKVDDLVYAKESVLLLAAQDLGLFDKNERSTLTDALNLRNKAGHPGRYKLGPKKASSFIEDVVSIVFAE